MITVLLWTLLVLHTIGLVATPWSVGKERKPITAGSAVVQSAINLSVIVLIILALVK